jgi:hypothetical protein
MVVDEGFDLSAPDLRGKVIGVYTVRCRSSATDAGAADAGAADAGAADVGAADAGAEGTDADAGDAGALPYDEVKRRYIRALGVPSTACRLDEGISAKGDPLASIAKYKARWNAMVRGQHFRNEVFSQAEWNELSPVIDAELKHFSSHGTATAGTVAHDNEAVRLVLVERELADPTTREADFTCLVQADLDLGAKLLAEPDVLAAYVSAPSSTYGRQLAAARTRHAVGVVNESFGSPARAVLEMLQQMKGCPAVDARAYFAAVHGATVASVTAAVFPNVLWIQSAGNDGLPLLSGADDYSCVPEDRHHLLVGSNDLVGVTSKFSNRGACVDVFAPGERIIAPYAGGWVFTVQGTSFAAPLVAWQLSRSTAVPFDAVAAHDAVAARAVYAADLYPRDFFYAPLGFTATTGALTTGDAPSPRPTAPLVSSYALEEALRPLTLLREITQR